MNLEISYEAMSTIERDLTKTEAELLTTWIKQDLESAWLKIGFANTHQAHKALGYGTWKEYVKKEFGVSESYSYRLLDQGKVITAIAQATATSPMGESITPQISERQARRIKPHLEETVAEIEERISGGEEPERVVGDTVKHYAGLGNHTVSPTEIACPNCNGTGYIVITTELVT